jgi:hypothetical protein
MPCEFTAKAAICRLRSRQERDRARAFRFRAVAEELTRLRMGKILKGRFPDLDEEDRRLCVSMASPP